MKVKAISVSRGAVPPRLFTVVEACDELRIGKSLFYVLVAHGRIRLTKIGARSLVDALEVARVAKRGA